MKKLYPDYEHDKEKDRKKALSIFNKTPYGLFADLERQRLKSEGHNLPKAEITVELKRRWEDMDQKTQMEWVVKKQKLMGADEM